MPEPREYPGIGVGSTAAVGPCAHIGRESCMERVFASV